MPFLEAQALEFGKDFENAHPLWNAEVSFILEKYLESHNNQRSNPQNSMIQRTLEYVRKLNNYSTAQNSQAARDLMKKGDKFTDYESALINNLNIASVDEAITLIPSLKDKFPNTEILQTRLAHLQDFQKSNDDTNYNITSYSAMSQGYHNPSGSMSGPSQPEPQEQEEQKEDPDPNVSQSPNLSSSPPHDGSSPTSNYSQTPQSDSSTSPYNEN
mmetsp:Transcript_40951/g.36133  ORF Transcript_40951/g.36133 Transcript_40951/m.36133 type:complete len:215 (+) Transcript_40951:104-748(+)